MGISEKVAYLKGLAEGLALDTESKEGKLIAAIIDVLDNMADEIADMQDEMVDIEDGLDAVSDDLSEAEESLYEPRQSACAMLTTRTRTRKSGTMRTRMKSAS